MTVPWCIEQHVVKTAEAVPIPLDADVVVQASSVGRQEGTMVVEEEPLLVTGEPIYATPLIESPPLSSSLEQHLPSYQRRGNMTPPFKAINAAATHCHQSNVIGGGMLCEVSSTTTKTRVNRGANHKIFADGGHWISHHSDREILSLPWNDDEYDVVTDLVLRRGWYVAAFTIVLFGGTILFIILTSLDPNCISKESHNGDGSVTVVCTDSWPNFYLLAMITIAGLMFMKACKLNRTLIKRYDDWVLRGGMKLSVDLPLPTGGNAAAAFDKKFAPPFGRRSASPSAKKRWVSFINGADTMQTTTSSVLSQSTARSVDCISVEAGGPKSRTDCHREAVVAAIASSYSLEDECRRALEAPDHVFGDACHGQQLREHMTAAHNGDNTCPSCQSQFVRGQELTRIPCQHVYHYHCLENHVSTYDSICKVCSYDMEESHGVIEMPVLACGDYLMKACAVCGDSLMKACAVCGIVSTAFVILILFAIFSSKGDPP